MNFNFALFFGILTIISNVCPFINGTPKRALFTVDSSFNNYVCIGNFTLEVVITTSVIGCASLCTDDDECDGFFHLIDNNTCVMCSDPFDDVVSEGLTVMFGTIFYRRNECEGIVRGFDEKEIQIYFEGKKQEDAQSVCQAKNGQLVQIRQASQMSHLSDALNSCSPSASIDFWTDGVYDTTTGKNVYSDGTAIPMGSADFWEDPTYPSRGPCIRLRKKAFDYRWNDKYCHKLYGFICEI